MLGRLQLKKRIWVVKSRTYSPTPLVISMIEIPDFKKLTHIWTQFYRYGPGIEGYRNDESLIFYDVYSISQLERNSICEIDGTFKTDLRCSTNSSQFLKYEEIMFPLYICSSDE
jgi:hypothetical protein